MTVELMVLIPLQMLIDYPNSLVAGGGAGMEGPSIPPASCPEVDRVPPPGSEVVAPPTKVNYRMLKGFVEYVFFWWGGVNF